MNSDFRISDSEFETDLGGIRNKKPYNNINSNRSNENFFTRSLSTNGGYRPRTKSMGSRKMVREDRNLLLVNEFRLSDSTPVLARKVVQDYCYD